MRKNIFKFSDFSVLQV